VFPYAAVLLAVAVSVLRWRRAPFTVSSISSQLLESRKLFWGSIPFHWGIVLILLGHLFTLFLPSTVAWWDGVPLRLYALEATGLALALWAGVGILVLLYRRLTTARIRVVTTPMDFVVLLVLLVQVVTGVWMAIGYRFGSLWATSTVVPYVWSLVKLQPRPDLLQPYPAVLQIHVVSFFTLVAIFPFTRLVHLVTLPLTYLTRPWQRVVRTREVEPVG
jgi:respiratory nitrate reductase, gamma subunit